MRGQTFGFLIPFGLWIFFFLNIYCLYNQKQYLRNMWGVLWEGGSPVIFVL